MKVLFIGAHADDCTIGAGGTISKLQKDKNNKITILVCTKGDYRNKDINLQRINRKKKIYPKCKIRYFDYEDQMLDTYPQAEIAQKIKNVINEEEPNIVFTHCHDINLDHKLVSNAVDVACRNLPITLYHFRVPGVKHSNLQPNTYIDITTELNKKIMNFQQFEEDYPSVETIVTQASLDRQQFCPDEIGQYEAFSLKKTGELVK